jgi:hypothetical protein
MKFENRTLNTDNRLNNAILVANKLLKDGSLMMDELYMKDDFKYNSGSGFKVFHAINDCAKIAPVYFYKPFNPFTKAMGYSDGKAIYLNSRKFSSFSFAYLVGLLCHEWLHLGPGFSHGNNYKTKEKCLYSVNYFVSENIAKWL